MSEFSEGYGEFARVYDRLTFNVPYDEIADCYDRLLSEITHGKRLLDMGCGTGNLTVKMARRGYDVTGQDASSEMLSIAASKSPDIRWICQKMEETDLGEQVDAVISTLDSVNHIESAEKISICFQKAAEHLKQGGAFVFDVNTVYKHREILGNNTFVYDLDDVYCVWSNFYEPSDNGVDIELDIFYENKDGLYTRGGDSFREIALGEREYRRLLSETGFEIVNVLDYPTLEPASEKSEKLFFSARKM